MKKIIIENQIKIIGLIILILIGILGYFYVILTTMNNNHDEYVTNIETLSKIVDNYNGTLTDLKAYSILLSEEDGANSSNLKEIESFSNEIYLNYTKSLKKIKYKDIADPIKKSNTYYSQNLKKLETNIDSLSDDEKKIVKNILDSLTLYMNGIVGSITKVDESIKTYNTYLNKHPFMGKIYQYAKIQ